MGNVDNNEDILDSRDIIERIEEIENEIQSRIMDDLYPDGEHPDGDGPSWGDVSDANIDAADGINVLPEDLWPTGLDEGTIAELWDLANELVPLRKLTSEAEGYCEDWRYGATLIRDSYFEEYAEQFADDIGAIDAKAGWPLMHIDWKAAAEALQQDYTEVEFDGVSYWVR
jgi:uncharacterized protein YeaO (DUF488 family)